MEKAKEKKGLSILFAIVAGFATVSVVLSELFNVILYRVQADEMYYAYQWETGRFEFVLQIVIMGALAIATILSAKKKELFFTLFASVNAYQFLINLVTNWNYASEYMHGEFEFEALLETVKLYGTDITEALLCLLIMIVALVGAWIWVKKEKTLLVLLSLIALVVVQLIGSLGQIKDSLEYIFKVDFDVIVMFRSLSWICRSSSVVLLSVAIAAYFIYLLIKRKKKPVEEQPAQEQVEEQVVME